MKVKRESKMTKLAWRLSWKRTLIRLDNLCPTVYVILYVNNYSAMLYAKSKSRDSYVLL